MKNKKLGLIFNIVVLCLCVCLITFGVYSAKTASLNVSGTVGFTAHDCNADIVIKTNGDSINASNERVSDGTTIRTTEAVLKTAIGESTTYSDSAVQIRGKDVTLKLESFYFSDMTTDGSVNDITLTFEITNQSDFSISANVSAVSCDGVAFYNSDGTTAFSSDVAEVVDISTKGATSTLTLILKYTATENITATDNFSININLQKTPQIQFKFDNVTYSAKKGSTWAEWLETSEAKALGLTLDSSGYVVTSKNRYINPNTHIWSSFDTLIKGSDIINLNAIYCTANSVPDKV